MVIADPMPLDVYSHYGRKLCSATNIIDALDGFTTPVPEVVIKDADGTTVAAFKTPRIGGRYDGSTGCTFPLDPVTVPPSDFYEVIVTARDNQIRTTTTQRDDSPTQTVEVTF
ncbi:MAG TPA: hypothetical protein VFK52_13015 [Nocardioidaceae bacterium]|nr:hypothetical protein [Nocardioidaceae bacterium]